MLSTKQTLTQEVLLVTLVEALSNDERISLTRKGENKIFLNL